MLLHEPPVVPPRFVEIGAWSARQGQDAPPHRHAEWKITYYRAGRIDSVVDGIVYEAIPGTVLVLRPNAVHEEVARTAYSNYWLLVDTDEPNPPWPAICSPDCEPDIGRLLAGILRESSATDPFSTGLLHALIETLDLTLRRADRTNRAPVSEATVRAVEQLFEEHYSGHLEMRDVARQVGVSTSSLRSYFAAIRGSSPTEVLRDIRMRHALAILRSSDLPLASIAQRCGFHSASHLSRRVIDATGTSPGRLR